MSNHEEDEDDYVIDAAGDAPECLLDALYRAYSLMIDMTRMEDFDDLPDKHRELGAAATVHILMAIHFVTGEDMASIRKSAERYGGELVRDDDDSGNERH